MSSTSSFIEYGEQLDQRLRDMECNAPEEHLFAYSYLMGHISLVTYEEGTDVAEFNLRMNEAIEQAFNVDRLSEDDKSLISHLWHQIKA